MNNLRLYLKAFLDRHIYLLPVIMLLACLYSNFFYIDYVLAGNVLGCSLLSNAMAAYLFNFKGRYCWLTRNAPIGLMFINLVDILGVYITNKWYVFIFNVAVCLTIIILASVFYIKKRLQHD